MSLSLVEDKRQSFRFSPLQRIGLQADFAKIKSTGHRIDCSRFVVLYLFKEAGPKRLGIIASRKVGKAHDRNKLKRWCREMFRLNQDKIPAHVDLVVILRSSALKADYSEMQERFLKACSKISPPYA